MNSNALDSRFACAWLTLTVTVYGPTTLGAVVFHTLRAQLSEEMIDRSIRHLKQKSTSVSRLVPTSAVNVTSSPTMGGRGSTCSIETQSRRGVGSGVGEGCLVASAAVAAAVARMVGVTGGDSGVVRVTRSVGLSSPPWTDEKIHKPNTTPNATKIMVAAAKTSKGRTTTAALRISDTIPFGKVTSRLIMATARPTKAMTKFGISSMLLAVGSARKDSQSAEASR